MDRQVDLSPNSPRTHLRSTSSNVKADSLYKKFKTKAASMVNDIVVEEPSPVTQSNSSQNKNLCIGTKNKVESEAELDNPYKS